MINDQAAEHTPYEQMLDKAFGHNCTNLNLFMSSFFHSDLRDVFLTLVEEGRPISELEAERFGVIDEGALTFQILGQGKGRPHYKAFVAGIKALLCDKDHHHVATEYIIANSSKYMEMSNGFFDETHRLLENLPLVSSCENLPNYCRNQDGTLRASKTITRLIEAVQDCDVLLLTAMAHRDSEAVRMLLAHQKFVAHMREPRAYGIIRRQIQQCPGIGLDEAFGDLFQKRTHVVFLAEMKQLMESSTATRKDFEVAFWPGASSVVIDRLVSQAVKFDYDANPQKQIMLEVFRDNNVDFYPGLMLAEKGEGYYFDAVIEAPDPIARHTFIMDVIGKRAKLQKQQTEQDLSSLLLDIPLETLVAHKDSDLLLKHLYKGTQDKEILKLIQDKQFKGDMLGDQLGL